jgi:cytochrome c5
LTNAKARHNVRADNVACDTSFLNHHTGVTTMKHIMTAVVFGFLLAGCGKSEAPQGTEPAASAESTAPAATTAAPEPTAPAPAAEAAAPVADATPAAAGAINGEDIYKKTCSLCHAAGVAGAPKLGDKADWGPRIAQGMDLLHEHAIKGFTGAKGMMPPKGANPALSDDEVKATVDYMVSQSQ